MSRPEECESSRRIAIDFAEWRPTTHIKKYRTIHNERATRYLQTKPYLCTLLMLTVSRAL
jgi:hypothetical protein